MIATPALLMTIMLTTSPRQTLLLKWPKWRSLAAAGLLAVVAQPLVGAVGEAVMTLYPLDPGGGSS